MWILLIIDHLKDFYIINWNEWLFEDLTLDNPLWTKSYKTRAQFLSVPKNAYIRRYKNDKFGVALFPIDMRKRTSNVIKAWRNSDYLTDYKFCYVASHSDLLEILGCNELEIYKE